MAAGVLSQRDKIFPLGSIKVAAVYNAAAAFVQSLASSGCALLPGPLFAPTTYRVLQEALTVSRLQNFFQADSTFPKGHGKEWLNCSKEHDKLQCALSVQVTVERNCADLVDALPVSRCSLLQLLCKCALARARWAYQD